MKKPNPNQPISFIYLLGAIFYDFLLVFSLIFVIGLLTSPFFIIENNQPNPWFFPIITMPINILYFCGFWYYSGQTPGLKSWQLKLVSTKHTLTIWQCLLRFMIALISWFFWLGFLYRYLNKERFTLHDKISGTQVIKMPS